MSKKSKWKTGKEIIDEEGIKDIELFDDYVRKGLQPYNDLGKPISPLYVVEKITNISWLIEQYHEKRYSEAELGNDELKKFDATIGHDLISQIENYENWVHSVKDLDWNRFELPETEAEAKAVLTELVGSLYHIDDIKKFFGVPEFEIDKKEIIPELPKAKAIRPSTKDKLEVQRVFKELLEKHPEFDTIKEFRNLPEIMEAGGKHYTKDKRHKWISEVAPKHLKRPGVRSKKK